MLDQAGITSLTTQLEINVILSAWQLVISIFGSCFAEKLGRRVLALASLGSCTLFFYILAGLTAKYGTDDNKSGTYGTTACIFLFSGAYAFGITPLTAMYSPEVLLYNIRATGLPMEVILFKAFGILVTFAFPYMLDAISWETYIINASWNIIIWAYVHLQWVETKGRTLEEIDEIFDGQMHAGSSLLAEKTGDIDFTVQGDQKTVSPLK